MSAPVPTEGRDWMDVPTAKSGNPASHEVPYSDATVIAANSKECPPSIEGTGEGFTPRV